MTIIVRPSATIDIDGTDLTLEPGSSCVLDSSAVRYGRATAVLSLVDDATLGWVDAALADGDRVPITANFGAGARTFDLGLRSRDVDHSQKTVTLTLSTDEALLEEYSVVTEDKGARAYESSLRGVVDYVLSKVPGVLGNRLSNSSGRTSLFGYTAVGAGAALELVAGVGTYSATLTGGIAGGSFGLIVQTLVVGVDLKPNTVYTFTTEGIAYNSTGGTTFMPWSLAATGTGTSYAWVTFPAASGFVRQQITFTTAASGNVDLSVLNGSASPTIAGGNWVGFRDAMVTEGTVPPPEWRHRVLMPAATDANVTAYWSVQNMVQNPSMQVDIVGWAIGTGAGSLSRVAVGVPAVAGTHALRWLTTIAGESNVLPLATSSTYGVTPGQSYVWSYYQYSGANTAARAIIRWYTSGNIYIGSSFGAAGTSTTAAFTRFSVIATAPEGAAYASPYVNTTGNTGAGLGHVVDGAMFYEGDEVVPYFDGSTAASATYTYAWTGDANASPSTRTPVVERLPQLFTWEPGVNAWDFLVPITGSENTILWCDEQRRWYLEAPDLRTVPDLLIVTPDNAAEGNDNLSRDSELTFLDGIVVKYRDGKLDVAGTAGKVRTVDLDRSFPGTGLAAAMLARSLGTGRVQTATVMGELDATPGMQVAFSLPGAPDTTGRLAAVDFDFSTGLSALTAAGLVDVVPGSIAALLGTIDSLVGTIDSL